MFLGLIQTLAPNEEIVTVFDSFPLRDEMDNQKRFACQDCHYEFYENQSDPEGNTPMRKCPKCGSSKIDELDFWGLRKKIWEKYYGHTKEI